MTDPQPSEQDAGYLTGQCLIAMPGMRDPRFEKSVVYMCSHSADGALGIIINKLLDDFKFSDLCGQLDIDITTPPSERVVHFGGPVEKGRGFVLHSDDYGQDEGTLWVKDGVGLTATLDVVRSMVENDRPARAVLALGYAGWGPGQLESEIQANGWLSCEADQNLLFDDDIDARWEQAFRKIGIDPGMLASSAGHA